MPNASDSSQARNSEVSNPSRESPPYGEAESSFIRRAVYFLYYFMLAVLRLLAKVVKKTRKMSRYIFRSVEHRVVNFFHQLMEKRRYCQIEALDGSWKLFKVFLDPGANTNLLWREAAEDELDLKDRIRYFDTPRTAIIKTLGGSIDIVGEVEIRIQGQLFEDIREIKFDLIDELDSFNFDVIIGNEVCAEEGWIDKYVFTSVGRSTKKRDKHATQAYRQQYNEDRQKNRAEVEEDQIRRRQQQQSRRQREQEPQRHA